MKKSPLLLVTKNGFWHADLTMLPFLNKFFDVSVINIMEKRKKNEIVNKPEYIKSYTSVYTPSSLKNPFNFFSACNLLYYLLVVYKNHKILYESSENPFINILVYLFISPRRIIISWHDFIPHSGSHKISYIMRSLFIKRFSKFRVHSHTQYAELQKKLENIKNKKACFNPLPLNNYGEPQGIFKIEKTYKKVFLFFGAITSYKNLPLLVNAINSLNDNILLIIAGRDNDNFLKNYNDLLQQNSEKFSLQIRFINDNEIADLFTIADYLVLPYLDTTQSGPLQIALSYSLPVITSDLEFFKFFVDEKKGFMFENNDLQSLIDVLQEAIDCSDEQTKQMKKTIQNFARAYQSSIEDSYKELYSIVISD